MPEKITRIPINPDEWLRGEGSANSRLWRRKDNKKCCIGIGCEFLGLPKSVLLPENHEISEVAGIPEEFVPVELDFLRPINITIDGYGDPITYGGEVVADVYSRNDEIGIPDLERVANINEAIKIAGGLVEFYLEKPK